MIGLPCGKETMTIY